ncbi:MAG: hypothetical protein IM600_17865 [Bacteroidetes bacterium]|nr:hypothetical protein [Bacteroidota bacterium]MCA6445300.1 hypothetical protein [Bacteroidota bacterium]
MQENEENQMLSLEQGRRLIENTSLSNLNDDELQELLESIKVFCEINFEMYLDVLRQVKMEEIDKDFSDDNVVLLNENNQENLQKAA